MATVLTALTAKARMPTWEIPPTPDPSYPAVPRGACVQSLDGSTEIAAKAADDISVFTLTATFPQNFVYVPTYIHFWARALDRATMQDWEPGQQCLFTSPGREEQTILLMNEGRTPVPFSGAYESIMITAAGAQVAAYSPVSQLAGLSVAIDCSQGDGTMVLTWVDESSDTSLATDPYFYMTSYVYTVAQWNAFRVHTPLRILQ